MKSEFSLFGEFQKAEKQDDGSIIISGIASTADRDSDGEIVTADAMKAALPDYMRFANIREMHQLKAAGVALEAEVNAQGETWIKAHIVDTEAVKKVNAGVYKGFSIGGKKTKRDEINKAMITGIILREISLVDRPCNPNAVLEMWKADASTKEKDAMQKTPEQIAIDEAATLAKTQADQAEAAALDLMAMSVEDLGKVADDASADDLNKRAVTAVSRKSAAGKGDALADGSFAIGTGDDLALAVKAYGRAKDKVLAKAHIEKRATALGLVDQLPAEWKAQDATIEKTEAVKEPIKVSDDVLQKGLYGVSRLADLLQSLSYVTDNSIREEATEGDDSAVPGKLKDALKALGDILCEMTTEEVAEMMAGKDAPDVIMLAARTIDLGEDKITVPVGTKLGKVLEFRKASTADNLESLSKVAGFDLEKVGARHNKGDKKRVQDIHDHAASMGADCKGGGVGGTSMTEKSASIDDLKKAIGVDATDENDVQKVIDRAVVTLTKVITERDDLVKVVADLKPKAEAWEKLPEPARGKVLVVGKADDITKVENQKDEEITKAAAMIDALPEDQKATALMKAIHAVGGQPLLQAGMTRSE